MLIPQSRSFLSTSSISSPSSFDRSLTDHVTLQTVKMTHGRLSFVAWETNVGAICICIWSASVCLFLSVRANSARHQCCSCLVFLSRLIHECLNNSLPFWWKPLTSRPGWQCWMQIRLIRNLWLITRIWKKLVVGTELMIHDSLRFAVLDTDVSALHYCTHFLPSTCLCVWWHTWASINSSGLALICTLVFLVPVISLAACGASIYEVHFIL